jgi:hypothetical protein
VTALARLPIGCRRTPAGRLERARGLHSMGRRSSGRPSPLGLFSEWLRDRSLEILGAVASRGEKLKFVRLVHETTGRRDPAGLELLDADVEWATSSYPFPDLAAVYRAHKGVAEFGPVGTPAGKSTSMEEFIDAGDEVVVATRVSGADATASSWTFGSMRSGRSGVASSCVS